MRRTLSDFVNHFADANGYIAEMEEGSVQATLTIEGMPIQLALSEELGLMIVQSGVALAPEDNKEAFYLKLLKMTNQWSTTTGFAFGLDAELDLVTLQFSCLLSPLDQEAFDKLMAEFIKATADALILLNSPDHEISSEDELKEAADISNDLFMNQAMNMIRI